MRVVLILLLSALASTAGAHGAAGHLEADARTVTLRFEYSVGEPMADAETAVYNAAGVLVQRGRTGPSGRFSFVPAAAGEWQVWVSDGLGHELSVPVTVDAQGLATAVGGPATVKLPPMLLLGLLLTSVALNGLLLLRLRRRSPS